MVQDLKTGDLVMITTPFPADDLELFLLVNRKICVGSPADSFWVVLSNEGQLRKIFERWLELVQARDE